MELSILQHNRDTSPQVVTIAQIADRILSDNWPPGYQPVMLVQGVFEGGVRQQDLTRLSGLSVSLFCHVDSSSLAELREEARTDPHTLLLYCVADSLVIIYPYELDVGYEVYLQRQFYQKAFLFGNDYYESLLGGSPCARARMPASAVRWDMMRMHTTIHRQNPSWPGKSRRAAVGRPVSRRALKAFASVSRTTWRRI